MEVVRTILNRITSIIKRSVLTLSSSDSGVTQVAQVSYLGKVANAELVSVYGLSSNAPVGSTVLLFNVQAQEENRAGIANYPGARFKNLKAGEVAVGNYVTKSVIKFLENGNIEITGKNDLNINITNDGNITIAGAATLNITGGTEINSPNNTLNGNLTINGNLSVNGDSVSTGNFTTSGDVIASGISLSTHVHGGVTPGGGTTDGPQ